MYLAFFNKTGFKVQQREFDSIFEVARFMRDGKWFLLYMVRL